jgi:hypothetical protein
MLSEVRRQKDEPDGLINPTRCGAAAAARYGADAAAEVLLLTGCDMSMPPPSWIRSRSAGLWRRIPPAVAARVAAANYGAEARAEVLLRAFLAERDRDADGVRFWLSVYDSLARPGRRGAGRP